MNKILKSTLLPAYLFYTLSVFSQNEAQKWYFGNKAGLDFSTNPPTALFNGSMTTGEGCATICNALGSLLFYTDGITVYDQTHSVMANGTGLMGNGSTTQSGIIVKQPGNNNIYYVFTQDDVAGPDGFRYSVVDMSLAAGLGSVTVKNFHLYTPSCEKITAVRHCNGVDAWVVTHDWNSNNFRTHLITAAGVNTVPVISSVGAAMTNTNAVAIRTLGQMKISPNGKKLGLVVYDTGIPAPMEIYDFDAATGMVSNPLVLGNFLSNYGCEFSPDGTKFYGARHSGSQLFQWDLCAGSSTAIVASQYLITTTISSVIGSLQLAIDGKIYLARANQTLSIINNPNASGAACNYVDAGLSTSPKASSLGLPNYINSFFKQNPAPFTFTSSCNSMSFTASQSNTYMTSCAAAGNTVTGQLWAFGEPSSGSANSSTLANPSHNYATPGTYTVQLVLYNQCSSDTIRLPVTIVNAAPNLAVAGTFTICNKDKRIYTVSGASSYTWSVGPNSTTISLSPTVTTSYSVTGTGTNSCKGTKVFTLTVNKCTGIDQSGIMENPLTIYPNPFQGKLIVETGAKIKLSILNQMGALVFEEFFEGGEHTIDVSSLSSGLYTVKSTSAHTVMIRRMIKIE